MSVPRSLRVSILHSLALCGALAVACNSGPPPQSVTPELPEVLTSTEPLVVTVRVRDASGVSGVGKPPYDVSIAPEGVAEVKKDGSLRCLKTGDAKLSVGISGVTGVAAVRCRLVDHLEVQPLSRIDINKGPFVLAAKAVAKDGKELGDVPITVSPSNGVPLKVKGLELTPVQVGETELSVRAGSAKTAIKTKVVRSLKPEALPLQNGRRINFSLSEGKYEITVALHSPKPLNVEWRGAPYCDYKGGAATSHTSMCVLQGSGGVVTDNPKFVDSGATDVSHDGIELYEVP